MLLCSSIICRFFKSLLLSLMPLICLVPHAKGTFKKAAKAAAAAEAAAQKPEQKQQKQQRQRQLQQHQKQQ